MGKRQAVSRGQFREALAIFRTGAALIAVVVLGIAFLAGTVTFAAGAIWHAVGWGPGPGYRGIFFVLIGAAAIWVVLVQLASAQPPSQRNRP